MKPVELLRKIDKVGVYRFTGTIDAGGVPIHVEIITGYRFGRLTFAVGFAFDSESFGKLSEKLSGIGVDFLDALGLELQVRFVPDVLIRGKVLLDWLLCLYLNNYSSWTRFVFPFYDLPIL